jgi:uncharacterized membrane protein
MRPLLLIAALACGGSDDDAPSGNSEPFRSAVPTGVIAGTLATRDGQLLFTPCGDSIGVRVHDGVGGEAASLLAELAPDGGRLSILARMTRDTMQEIRYAGHEGPSCENLPPRGDIVAQGQEPFWRVVVDGDSVVASSPDMPDGERHGNGAWSPVEQAGWRFVAVSPAADTLQLEVHPGRCLDAMSGARYPWRATLRWRAIQASGCALEGRGP